MKSAIAYFPSSYNNAAEQCPYQLIIGGDRLVIICKTCELDFDVLAGLLDDSVGERLEGLTANDDVRARTAVIGQISVTVQTQVAEMRTTIFCTNAFLFSMSLRRRSRPIAPVVGD